MAKEFKNDTVNFSDGSNKSVEYDMEIGENTAREEYYYTDSDELVSLGDYAHIVTVTSVTLQETKFFFEDKEEAHKFFSSIA